MRVIKESSLLKMVRPIKYLPASVTGRSFLPQMGMENLLEHLLNLSQSLAYRSNVSLQSIFIFEPSTTTHLGTNVLKKPRFVSLFIFIAVKTALEMSVTKTATKDLRKIRTIMVLTLMLIAAVSAFKVSVTKTASEKRFD
jgi:hypothetical protein